MPGKYNRKSVPVSDSYPAITDLVDEKEEMPIARVHVRCMNRGVACQSLGISVYVNGGPHLRYQEHIYGQSDCCTDERTLGKDDGRVCG